MAGPGRDNFTIARPTGVCAATGEAIEAGEGFVACLIETDDGRLERRDFSHRAWNDGARPDVRPLGSWRAIMAEPGDAPRRFIDDGALCDLFEQFEGEAEERRVGFRYLLALVLVRKRLLHVADSAPERMLVQWTRRSGRMTAPSQGEEACIGVPSPALDQDDLVALAEDFDGVFGGESS